MLCTAAVFETFCASLNVPFWRVSEATQIDTVMQTAWKTHGPAVIEIDMPAWGAFAVKFAGPPKKTA